MIRSIAADIDSSNAFIGLAMLGGSALWILRDFFLLLGGQYVDGNGQQVTPPWEHELSGGVRIVIVLGLLVLGYIICSH